MPTAEVIPTKHFLRELKKLSKRHRSIKDDVDNLIGGLRTNPLEGTDLGHNMRKIRLPISSKGRGKSGGARVITHVIVVAEVDEATVRLLTIYDKSEKESVPDSKLLEILKQEGLL